MELDILLYQIQEGTYETSSQNYDTWCSWKKDGARKNGKLLRERQYKHYVLTVSMKVMLTKLGEFQKIMGNFPK